MINNDFRTYNFYLYEDKDAYGQLRLNAEPTGKVKMAIYITNQAIQDNINYKSANYVGFTHSLFIDESHVIDYNGEKLKVLYVNPQGRLKQVFLTKI